MSTISRRDFLKNMGAGVVSLALTGHSEKSNARSSTQLGRVAKDTSISVYSQASENSAIRFQRYRDEIFHIYDEVVAPDGPGYNPLWYRIWGGYVHSGFVQKVQYRLNTLITEFPSQGQLMELTVPYSDSYRHRINEKWEKFYRLYYSSTYWVFSAKEGPDGMLWYEIRDGLVDLSYYVPVEHLRPVTAEELTPIHADIAPSLKRIEISIDFQKLMAYEGSQLVKEMRVSTGVPYLSSAPNTIPTDTPKGNFKIHAKRPSVHMGDGTLRSDAEAYELPGVPWVSYFESSTGVAIHGTYWHQNFGMVMSHGCINMESEDAKWVYRWTNVPDDGNSEGYRTPVLVY
ncbi:MAG TPA: L,D-transpeptidase [Anaerolineaceae bacterium]|nr:L,D-transpeptidase [Anaerolineaceae bacterium]